MLQCTLLQIQPFTINEINYVKSHISYDCPNRVYL
jgi:hypothetical protein